MDQGNFIQYVSQGLRVIRMWRSSWEVFAFAMEVLQAASRARLEKVCLSHPEVVYWWIVAMADSRCPAGAHAFLTLNLLAPGMSCVANHEGSFATIVSAAKLACEGFGRATVSVEDGSRPDDVKQHENTRRGRWRKRARSASSSSYLVSMTSAARRKSGRQRQELGCTSC